MSPAEKRQKNREYYEQRKEEIKRKARERYHRLKLVSKSDDERKTPNGGAVKKAAKLSLCAPNAKPSPRKLKSDVRRTEKSGIPMSFSAGSTEDFQISYTLDIDLSDLEKKMEKGQSLRMVRVTGNYSENFQTSDSESDTLEAEKLKNQESRNQWSVVLKIFQSPELFFRTLFGIGLTTLLVLLQVEFYERHDSSQYPVAMAIACEACLIMLAATRFRSRWMNIGKVLTYSGLFLYVLGSLSFDVFSEKRNDLVTQTVTQSPSSARVSLQAQLEQAQKSLEISTKRESWPNMKLFGGEVRDIRGQLEIIGKADRLGVSNSEASLFSIILLVILRGTLLICNSLNVLRISQFVVLKPNRN